MEHTANSQDSTCGICESEARMLSILEDHLEIRHMSKKALWWQEIQKTEHYCDKFGKKFFLSEDIIYVMKNTTSSVFMEKVFQKDGKLKGKNLSQKNVLGVLAAKFRIGSAFLE